MSLNMSDIMGRDGAAEARNSRVAIGNCDNAQSDQSA